MIFTTVLFCLLIYLCLNKQILFVAVFLGCTSTGLAGFMVFVVLCPGTPEGSTGSGSDFKASQKTGQRSHPADWEKPGIEACDPWFTRHRFIPYTTADCYVNR